MSKTRNNTNTALTALVNFTGPIERTNNMVTIAVTALTARNATLTIRQYATEGEAASLTSTFVMVGGSTYFCGQPVVLPFFNVTLANAAGEAHGFTTVNTVLYPNNVNDHKLQFVNTQTQHMLIQGSRGNVFRGTLPPGTVFDGTGATEPFNCSTFGNNSVLCYEDNDRASQDNIIVQASTTVEGDEEWVAIGALTVFVPCIDPDNRYSFASIRLAAFKRVRIFNISVAEKLGCVCSIYSS